MEAAARECDRWIALGDGSHKRFLLAKVMERLGRFDHAERELRRALEMDPEYPEASLGLLVLLVRRLAEPGVASTELLQEIDRRVRAEGIALATDPAPGRQAGRLQLGITTAVILALIGDVDGAAGIARGLRLLEPDNPDVREVLAAIDRGDE